MLSNSRMSLEDNTMHRQTELLVTDYLQAMNCKKTLAEVSRPFSNKKSSELFTNMELANKNQENPHPSVLEFMLTAQEIKKSEGHNEWTKNEVSALKKAVKAVLAADLGRSERWKTIASRMGEFGKMPIRTFSKKECYEKYKELKAAKKTAESKDGSKKSGGHLKEAALDALVMTESSEEVDVMMMYVFSKFIIYKLQHSKFKFFRPRSDCSDLYMEDCDDDDFEDSSAVIQPMNSSMGKKTQKIN